MTKETIPVTEKALRDAARKADEAILNQLEQTLADTEANEGAHVFSDAFEENMAKLLSKTKLSPAKRKRKYRFGYLAAAAALMVAVISGCLLARTSSMTTQLPGGTDLAATKEDTSAARPDTDASKEPLQEEAPSGEDAHLADAGDASDEALLADAPDAVSDPQAETEPKENRIISFFKSLGERKKANPDAPSEEETMLAAADAASKDTTGTGDEMAQTLGSTNAPAAQEGASYTQSARADTARSTEDTGHSVEQPGTAKDQKDAALARSSASLGRSATLNGSNLADNVGGVKKADYNHDKSAANASDSAQEEEEETPDEKTKDEDDAVTDDEVTEEEAADDALPPAAEETAEDAAEPAPDETKEPSSEEAAAVTEDVAPSLPGGVSIGDTLYGFSSASTIVVTNHANGQSATLTVEDAELSNILAAFNGFRVADAAESSASGAYSVNIDGTSINFDADHIYRGGVCFTGSGLGAVCAFISQLCS